MPIQCLLVGSEVYLASTLVANAISGREQFARYCRAPMASLYGYFEFRTSSFARLGPRTSVSGPRVLTTMGIFAVFRASPILNRSSTFFV